MFIASQVITISGIAFLVYGQNITNAPSNKSNIATTDNIFTTVNNKCKGDISPDPDYSCLDFYRWGECEAEYMKGYCCGTCGYSSCLDICYDNNIANIPSKYYPNPFDCSSNEKLDDTACNVRKEWGNCPDWYMKGFCCAACPEACDCLNSTINSNRTTTETVSVTHNYNYTNSQSNCKKDIPPPPGSDGVIFKCIDQYRWRNCEQSWMEGYCCLTCGYASCLDICYDGDVNNIASLYYPSPFDCENNAFVENEKDSCTDEREWGNCDEDWMWGLCCVSCPEACGCEDYEWINNTEYIKLRPNVIVTMSYEQIVYWENVYISLHALLLLFIFLILLVMAHQSYYNEIMERIALTMSRSVSSDPEQQSTTDYSTGTRIGSRTRSTRTTTGSRTDGSVDKSKVYDLYKLLAGASIFLCILVPICYIITFVLYRNIHDNSHILKPCAVFKMCIYVISKMIMYGSFILRIYFVFKNSAYEYSKKFVSFLFICLAMDTIIKLVCFTENIIKLEGDVKDKEIFEGKQTDYWLYWAFIILFIEELLFTTLLTVAFVKPLFSMTQKANVMSEKILDVMSKYVVLGIIYTFSSSIVSISEIFYMSTTELFVIWTIGLMQSVDVVINTYCTIFLFSIATNWYKILCGPCNTFVKSLYIKRFNAINTNTTNNTTNIEMN